MDRAGREADVVVLGGGPGGYACALRAADLGLSVALVEADKVGGTCLHHGCIPTRAMLHAASLADAAERLAPKWGIATAVTDVDMTALLRARDRVVDLNHHAVERHLRDAGVSVISGKGWLTGPRTVAVEGDTVVARRAVVLATGSRPRALDGVVADGRRVLTSDQALALQHVPRSAIVLGGGAIGAELTQVWRALGADVTIVEIQPRLVPGEDADVGKELSKALRRRGVRVLTDATTRDVVVGDADVRLTIEVSGAPTSLSAEVVLLGIGRTPNSDTIGLAEAGVRADNGFVTPGDWSALQTSVDGVYVLGDLVPPPSQMRANAAYAEGRLVAERIAGQRGPGIDYRNVPRVTHGIIETAAVGLSEAEARAEHAEIDVVTVPLGAVARGVMHGEGGMAKVIAVRGGPVVGVAMVGPQVTELIGESLLMTGFEALPADVAPLAHAHPTLGEVLSEAAMALDGRPLHWRT